MTDADLKKLQDENKTLKDKVAELTSVKVQAETDKAIAEAQRATILAHLPPTETKALEGKTTVDATVVSGIQLQAYKAIRNLVTQMGKAIQRAGPQLDTILFYNERDLTALAYYQTVKRELSLLGEGYAVALTKDTAAPVSSEAGVPAPGVAFMGALLAPAVVGTALKSVIDLIALFRTNVDIKGATVTFDEASLVAEVAKGLRAAYAAKSAQRQADDGAQQEHSDENAAEEKARRVGLDIIYSTLAIPGMFDATGDRDSALINGFATVGQKRQEAEMVVAVFDNQDAAAKNSNPYKQSIAQLKSLNKRFDQLLTSIGQIDDRTNISALTNLLKGELLADKMQSRASAILFIKAVGGGESKTTQSLWRSGRLYQSGMAILTYLLFSNEGELVLSDLLFETTEFAELK